MGASTEPEPGFGALDGRCLTIFTEGDAQKGLGHLSRCSAYAERFADLGGRVRWFVEGEGLARIDARFEPVAWKKVPAPPDLDLVLVDAYDIGDTFMASLAGTQALFIEDTGLRRYDSGLVVHAPGRPPDPPDGAQWLCGLHWQSVRRAFWDVPPRSQTRDDIGRVLVMMGGSDVRGLGARAVEAVRAALPDADIHLVQGAGVSAADTLSGVTVHSRLGPEAMAALMQQCDLAVSAAGQSLFELARCGVPTLAIGVADNQAMHLTGIDDEQQPDRAVPGCVAVGWWDDPHLWDKLGRTMGALKDRRARAQLSRRGQGAIDGLGTHRVIARLTEAASGACARLAELRDGARLHAWRNDPVTRQMALHGAEVSWPDHLDWLERQIASARVCLYVIEIDGWPMAMVRLDRDGASAEVSIALSPEARGRRLSGPALEAALAAAEAEGFAREFVAVVREENAASHALFRSLGFARGEAAHGVIRWTRAAALAKPAGL
ncbi:MAG: GNAT family N-acetyltransferase [Brevundimonas sp.]|uniref:GNAT family N-acetyltransferase n=1 Tax=Brevundimonas sp. TaxID=1871086 RepID=UPI00391AD9BF